MNYKKLLISLVLISSYSYSQTAPTSGAYETDKTDYFVAGNRVNESLERVNLLLCYLDNTKPLDFLNKGPYVATIFEDDCNFGKAKSGDKNKANQSSRGASGNKNSKKSSSNKEGKSGNIVYLEVKQQDDSSPMNGKVWIQLKAEPQLTPNVTQSGPGDGGPQSDGLPFDATVYLKHNQTSSAGPDSKLGDFTMNYSLYADATKVANESDVPGLMDNLSAQNITAIDLSTKSQKEKIEALNFSVGNGYIKSEGQTITFKEGIMGVTDIKITYTSTGASGVYSSEFWSPTPQGKLIIYYAFIIDDLNKWFCEKPIAASSAPNNNLLFDFNAADGKIGIAEGQIGASNDVALNSAGLSSTNEVCYSTSRDEAYVNVHQYGVYDDNGAQAGLSGGSFPIKAENTNGDDYYGWADYWGVWVDTYAREDFEPSNFSWKRNDGQTNGPCTSNAGCSLSKRYTEITKFETTYRSLNSLNKIKLSLYVADSYWEAEWGHADILNTTARNGGTACTWTHFENVSNTVCYNEYEGYWDSSTESLILTHGMKWARAYSDPNNPLDPKVDIADITIPAAEFVDHMKKTYGTDKYVIDLWTWSPDTWESFQIPGGAFSAPASVSPGVGIKNETIDRISIAQLQTDLTNKSATGLFCVNNCLDPNLLNNRYVTAANALADNNENNDNVTSLPVDSIFDANAATWHDPNTNPSSTGDKFYLDGITSSYAKEYVINNGKLWYENQNSADNEMTIFNGTVSALAAASAKQEQPLSWNLGGFQAKRPGYDTNNWEVEYIGWAARTGYLVTNDSTTLGSLECRKQGNGTDYVEFDADHPRYIGNATLMNATRYCYDKINQGAISTYYEIAILMEGAYEVSEGGSPIVFEQPKNLELNPTTWTAAQKTAAGMSDAEAEKTYSLWFEGFGKLYNIPGGVFNTCTGEDMGTYFYGNWDENCHRWASKFILPKGTYLTDKKGTIDTADDVRYWVKPLLGDEFLKVLSGASLPAQARDYSSLTKDILGSPSDLIDVGPNGTVENYIGVVPTDPLNNGDPSVVHGKVIAAPQ